MLHSELASISALACLQRLSLETYAAGDAPMALQLTCPPALQHLQLLGDRRWVGLCESRLTS